jgi:hypothetical protein
MSAISSYIIIKPSKGYKKKHEVLIVVWTGKTSSCCWTMDAYRKARTEKGPKRGGGEISGLIAIRPEKDSNVKEKFPKIFCVKSWQEIWSPNAKRMNEGKGLIRKSLWKANLSIPVSQTVALGRFSESLSVLACRPIIPRAGLVQ